MNSKLPRFFIIISLGFGCLLAGLFIWENPALASMANPTTVTVPTQEILWGPMQIAKPGIIPSEPGDFASEIVDAVSLELGSESETPTVSPTETPGTLIMEIVDDDADLTNESTPQIAPVGESERWIEVDLSEQQTYAYEGDVLVNAFIVSTGLPATPTVTGEYAIYVKIPIQDMSGPGYYLADVPWVMYFYDEYGFHGTYWHNNFGTPMSRGCVNLTIDDAKWLYDWASVGTPVSVHQ